MVSTHRVQYKILVRPSGFRSGRTLNDAGRTSETLFIFVKERFI